MKKVFRFLKNHPLLCALWVLSVVMMFFDETSGVLMAMAAPVVPGASEAPGAVAVGGGGTQGTSTGIAGMGTQAPGAATTVSHAREVGEYIDNEIDNEITKIGTDENVLDTIKRRAKRQVKVTSFEVEHYMLDEKRVKANTSAEYNANGERALIPFADSSDRSLFKVYYTVLFKGVDGYSADGQTKLAGVDLAGYVVGKDTTTDNPIIIALNGPKDNPTDEVCKMPVIPQGTEVIILSSAAYETQKFIAPDTVVPIPEKVFLQKHLANSIVSKYFAAQKKKVKFGKSQLAEHFIRQYRLDNCRTAWIGQQGKVLVEAQDKSLGMQYAYTSRGIRWQIKRQYDLAGKITFADLVNLSMVKFTGFNCSKKAVWLLGKYLLRDIQTIDLTLHKDITMTAAKSTFGFDATRIHTVFGDIDLIHDPTLDVLGYSNCGALLDESGIVRYYMKNEESETEEVTGEEADRDIVMDIDTLCLKGFSHIWVGNDGVDNGLIARICSGNSLPENPSLNTVLVLTGDIAASSITGNVAFETGDVIQFNGSIWKLYDGSMVAN